jgi:hypothetical protein
VPDANSTCAKPVADLDYALIFHEFGHSTGTGQRTMPVFQKRLMPLSALIISLVVVRISLAIDLYVDNRDGDDINDARSPELVGGLHGPVKSISRALKYCRGGDTVHIANHGTPYFESLEMVGPRFSGGFEIDGNGAVVSGARLVPFDAWQSLGGGLWRFKPYRKAFYQLIRDDKALPEVPCSVAAINLPEIPQGYWCAWRGSIYYRALPGESLTKYDRPLAFAAEEVGITLLDVNDATIHNLELRHFRLDGVNAHDRSRKVILDNVRLIENGRSGLAVGGTSLVGLKDSTVERNRLADVLNTELAQTEILTSKFTPARAPFGKGGQIWIKGGHVLIDGEEVFEQHVP